jgi:excisionase family DNA binding protein
MSDPSPYLTPRELADELKTSVETIRRWANEGRLPVIRLSRNVQRFKLPDVLKHLSQTQAPQPAA